MGGGFSRPYERLLMLVEKTVVSLKSSWGGAGLSARMRDFRRWLRSRLLSWSHPDGGRFQPPV